MSGVQIPPSQHVGVAQQEERQIPNLKVGGSSPFIHARSSVTNQEMIDESDIRTIDEKLGCLDEADRHAVDDELSRLNVLLKMFDKGRVARHKDHYRITLRSGTEWSYLSLKGLTKAVKLVTSA